MTCLQISLQLLTNLFLLSGSISPAQQFWQITALSLRHLWTISLLVTNSKVHIDKSHPLSLFFSLPPHSWCFFMWNQPKLNTINLEEILKNRSYVIENDLKELTFLKWFLPEFCPRYINHHSTFLFLAVHLDAASLEMMTSPSRDPSL